MNFIHRVPIERLIPVGYEVYADGKIVSHLRKTPHVMTPTLNKDGYMIVTITIGSKKWTQYVHAMVAAKFLPPRPSDLHVLRHKNGIQSENNRENLEWGLPVDNSADREKHGRTAKGEASGASHLTNDQVLSMRAEVGMSYAALGRKYGCSDVMARLIVLRKFWRHI